MLLRDIVDSLRPYIMLARQRAAEEPDILRDLAPVRPVNDFRYKLGRALRTDQVAPVRALGTPSTPIRRPGVVTIEGQLPAITPRADIDEDDLIRYATLLNADTATADLITANVARATVEVADTIDNTLSLMRGQLFAFGVVTIDTAEGQTQGVEFGVPAATTVGTPWNAAGATPLANYEAAVDDYVTRNGSRPGFAVTSSSKKAALRRDLQGKYPTSPVGNAALTSYLQDNDLPAVVAYDKQIVVQGETIAEDVSRRVYPTDRLTLLPPLGTQVASTQLGITAEARMQAQAGILRLSEVAGITIVTMGQDDPPKLAVKGSALGLPVAERPRAIYILDGLGA